jgi:hypothetical protein
VADIRNPGGGVGHPEVIVEVLRIDILGSKQSKTRVWYILKTTIFQIFFKENIQIIGQKTIRSSCKSQVLQDV